MTRLARASGRCCSVMISAGSLLQFRTDTEIDGQADTSREIINEVTVRTKVEMARPEAGRQLWRLKALKSDRLRRGRIVIVLHGAQYADRENLQRIVDGTNDGAMRLGKNIHLDQDRAHDLGGASLLPDRSVARGYELSRLT